MIVRNLEDRPKGSCAKWAEGCDDPRLPYSHLCRWHNAEYRRDRYRVAQEEAVKAAEEYEIQRTLARLDETYGPPPT